LFLLETWNTKFGGLLDQASSSLPPQSFVATNTNLFKEHGKKIFHQETLINTSICGTNGSTTMNNLTTTNNFTLTINSNYNSVVL
jgi:hypothetical protein